MVLLKQSEDAYNNDFRSMIMAFFPGEKIITDEGLIEKYKQNSKDYNFNTRLLFVFCADYSLEETVISLENISEELKNVKSDKTEEYEDNVRINDFVERIDTYTFRIIGDYQNRKVFRNNLKLAIYNLLKSIAGYSLPWGDLTGVRPTKIALKNLKQGISLEETIKNYMNTYEVSERKAKLATKVADKELRLVKNIDLADSYCLYIGIPFCPSRCLYCSFTAYAISYHSDKVDAYLDRLCEEISIIAEMYKDKKLAAIYIGGGTPTSINHIQLDRLLSHIDKVYNINVDDITAKSSCIDKEKNESGANALLEYTIEAGRPDSITREKLEVMRKHNITRISINPQTMNDETLRTIGRAHTSSMVEEVFKLARKMGFDNINMDLIAGLPGENIDNMCYTLERIRRLKPDSLTVHSLAVKRAANLNLNMKEYKEEINHDTDAMLDLVSDFADEAGMEPYYLYRQKNIGGNLENVGYSRLGKECIYNVLIMEELTDIIAAGAGSSTKYVIRDKAGNITKIDRAENCKSIDDYIDRFDEMIARKKAIVN